MSLLIKNIKNLQNGDKNGKFLKKGISVSIHIKNKHKSDKRDEILYEWHIKVSAADLLRRKLY